MRQNGQWLAVDLETCDAAMNGLATSDLTPHCGVTHGGITEGVKLVRDVEKQHAAVVLPDAHETKRIGPWSDTHTSGRGLKVDCTD